MARMKFICDAERCIECNGCVTACKQEHEVPWDELAFPTIERTLQHFFADRRHGEFPLHISAVTLEDRERHFGSA